MKGKNDDVCQNFVVFNSTIKGREKIIFLGKNKNDPYIFDLVVCKYNNKALYYRAF